MVLIIHCLLYNLNFNHCQQTTVKSTCWLIKIITQVIGMMMFKTNVAGYLHRKLIKVCQHYYFDVMTNIKRQDKYYWISTSQDNKSCQHFYDVMTNFKHQKEKSLGHRHHRKHIPNSGFFSKSSSLIMDWFGKQSIFTMVSFQGIQLNHEQKILARK